jgi:hypothetical protein
MKIKSLLAAVSMVAIAAGSANALDITNVTPNGIVPALELELPGNPALTGTFTFDVDTTSGSFYPSANNLRVKIDLPAGVTFSQVVQGTDITGGNSPFIETGGTVGANTVTFVTSIPQNTQISTLGFNLDLGLDSCPVAGSPLTVTIETELGTPVDGGTASTSGLIAPCASAISGMIMSDEAQSDTKITLGTGYTDIAEFAGSGPLNTDGVIGTVQYKIDPTVSTSLTSVTPLVAGDVAAFMFDVVFEDASGIDKVFVNGIPSVKSGNAFTVMATAGADKLKLLDGTPDSIIAFANGTVVIPTQTVSVGNSKITFRTTLTPDLIASEAGPVGPLDTLQREGREFGYFDWNGGQAAGNGALTVYRITGLDPNMPVDYSLTLENSNANGTYPGTVTANSYGEATLVSTTMPIPATVERFDVLINVETPNTDVDIDRLISKGGIISAFNDGANNDQEDIKEPNLNDEDN